MILRAPGWSLRVRPIWPTLALLSLLWAGAFCVTDTLCAREKARRVQPAEEVEEVAEEEEKMASDAEEAPDETAESPRDKSREEDDHVTPLSLRNLRRIAHEEDEELSEEDAEIVTIGDAVAPGNDLDYGTELKQLQKRLAELESAEKKRLASEKKAADAKKATEKKDEWVDTSTEKWTIKMGGHLQMDYINWANASPSIVGDQDYFEFRRVRLVAEGTGYGVYDFRLQMTLEPETVSDTSTVTNPSVKDAYFSINEVPWFGRIRVGNFFVPFGLEQVTNDAMNVFMERSIPTQGVLTADREVGVASYNVSADQSLTWTTGVFFDSISESTKVRVDDNQGMRLSGRGTWCPYYDENSNGRYAIHTGAGVLYTRDQDHTVRFRTRPEIHTGPRLIDSGNIAADAYTTGNLEAAVVWGRLTLQSEAYLTTIDRTNGGTPNIGGAYAHASYFLTGENRNYERFGQHGAQFGRSVPYENVFFVPGARGLGGWEAKARWSYLNLNSLNAGQIEDMTIGMNWYWSDRTRIMFDWIRPNTTSGATFGSATADILAMRFDVAW